MEEKDFYHTLASQTEEVLFKDRASKFYGIAFPVKNEDEIKTHLEDLKARHHKAGHFCYAWRLGKQGDRYRANDDGEPSNSAGMPIYGQLIAHELTEVLVVVLRYFGGTKLGVGGLINAYRTTAKMALENADIVRKTINITYKISFEYPDINKVMRAIKEQNLQVVNQILEVRCTIFISVRKKNTDKIMHIFDNIHGVEIEIMED